jgi:hypothetical protein
VAACGQKDHLGHAGAVHRALAAAGGGRVATQDEGAATSNHRGVAERVEGGAVDGQGGAGDGRDAQGGSGNAGLAARPALQRTGTATGAE